LTLVAVSQRVVTDARDGERRDALDQRWAGFLAACGLRALPVPNRPEDAVDLVETAGARGVLLTGGGDIGTLGGKDAERDETEALLVGWARWHGFPIVGVCAVCRSSRRCSVSLWSRCPAMSATATR